MARCLSIRGSSTTTKRKEVLKSYFKDVKKEEMVSVETEADIAREMKNELEKSGSKFKKTDRFFEYRNKLFLINIRFFISVANKQTWKGIEASDLNSASALGAIEAAGKFDVSKGFKFITYGVPYARSFVQLEVANSKFVRIPGNQRVLFDQAKRCNQRLEVILGRDATPKEITEQLLKEQALKDKDRGTETKSKRREITVERVKEALAANVRIYSYDEPIESDGDTTKLDFYADESIEAKTDFSLMKESLRRDINRVFSDAIKRNKATERDVEFFYKYFGFDLGPLEFTKNYEMLGNEYNEKPSTIKYRVERLIIELQKNKSLFLNYVTFLC